MIAAATMIAACASDSPSRPRRSISSGRLTQAQQEQDTVNFAECMRSHGVITKAAVARFVAGQ